MMIDRFEQAMDMQFGQSDMALAGPFKPTLMSVNGAALAYDAQSCSNLSGPDNPFMVFCSIRDCNLRNPSS